VTRSTARVAWQDVPFAKGAIWVVCGPIAPLTPELVARTLNNMASHGPATRVGLIPAGGTRKWKFDSRPGDAAVETDLKFDTDDVNKILTQFMKTSPEVPIQVVAPGAGDYVCMYVDHGVGDAHLIIELYVALSQAAKYGDFVPPVPGSMKTPLLSSFWNATKSDPKGMWSEALDLVKSAAGRRLSRSNNDHAPQDVTTEPPVLDVRPGSATAVFVKSREGYIDELRAYRASSGQTATVTTYVIRSIYHALRNAGIDVSDDILVMMDLRRFLPPGRWSLANLSAPVVVSVTPDMSSEEFTAAAFWQVASRKPLLRMMGRAVAARIQGLPAAEDMVNSQNNGMRVKRPLIISISDVTKIPASEKKSFKPGFEVDDINLAIALQAPDPSYVNICMITAPEDRAIHLTATFYDSHLDPELARGALKKALEIPGSPRPEA
jgi:hypothetical protein